MPAFQLTGGLIRKVAIAAATLWFGSASVTPGEAQSGRHKVTNDVTPSYICTPSGFGRTATCTLRSNNYSSNYIIFGRAG